MALPASGTISFQDFNIQRGQASPYTQQIDMATAAKQNGLANFMADRQTALQKWCWQLRASLKDVEME